MEAYSGSASRNENENENVRRYALAVLAASIALLLRRMLTPLLGRELSLSHALGSNRFLRLVLWARPFDSHGVGRGRRDLVLVPAAGPFLRASRSQG